jgi:hypothetical protein
MKNYYPSHPNHEKLLSYTPKKYPTHPKIAKNPSLKSFMGQLLPVESDQN